MELVVILIALWVEAVEDSPTKGKDGPSPSQPVAPVEFMIDPQVDTLDELDGEEDQAAGLEDNWRRQGMVKHKMSFLKYNHNVILCSASTENKQNKCEQHFLNMSTIRKQLTLVEVLHFNNIAPTNRCALPSSDHTVICITV